MQTPDPLLQGATIGWSEIGHQHRYSGADPEQTSCRGGYSLERVKTHLATALALRACLARRRVLFTQATALLDTLVAAQVASTLGRTLQLLRGQDLLVVDELGYTPMDAQRATLFFQLVSQKYAHSSLIVTTNVAFEHWGRIFGHDDVLAAAILDRLLHHAEVFAIDGPSYRLRGKRGPAPAGER